MNVDVNLSFAFESIMCEMANVVGKNFAGTSFYYRSDFSLPGGGGGNKAETLVAASLPLQLLLLLLLPLLHSVLAGLAGPLLPSLHNLKEKSKGYMTYLSHLRYVRIMQIGTVPYRTLQYSMMG
jgi:hypothetical protein